MAQGIGELIARFESARHNLTSALEQGDAESGGAILEADRELTSVFSQIMEVELSGKEECAQRIEFLLSEITIASDRDSLIRTLAEQAIVDVKQAIASAVPEPKPVSAAS
ncbi:MAG: hypothetical protein ABJM29_17165 [Rhizobiaceae bacterium]